MRFAYGKLPVLQREQDRADGRNDCGAPPLEPQAAGQLDLNSGGAASAVTNILWVDPAVLVAGHTRFDAGRSDGSADLHPQWAIQATEQDLRYIAPTTVYGDDMIAAGEERETPWLIEAVTRQMQRRVIARCSQPFEQIQVEFRSGDRACDLRGSHLDCTAMRSEDGDLRLRPVLDTNVEICAFDVHRGKVCIACESGIGALHVAPL